MGPRPSHSWPMPRAGPECVYGGARLRDGRSDWWCGDRIGGAMNMFFLFYLSGVGIGLYIFRSIPFEGPT